MVSTPRNSFNRETIMPSIKPEVVEFFQNHLDPNMTPEQITDAIESLRPDSRPIRPNPILGEIVNLLYIGDSTNLVSVIMQDNSSGNLYTLSSNPNINAEFDLIDVANLNDFQFRLQDAFNHQSLVNIYYEDNRIDSLVIIAKQIQESEQFPPLINGVGMNSSGGKCRYGSPPCK